MAKDERIQIRIDSETKMKLKEIADKDGRTISNYISMLIDRELKK